MSFRERVVHLLRPEQVGPDGPDRPAGSVGSVGAIRPDRPAGSVGSVGAIGPDRLAAYNTSDARSVLAQLLARAAGGEEIVIARAGEPMAKLVPYDGERLRPGVIRTHVRVVWKRAVEARKR